MGKAWGVWMALVASGWGAAAAAQTPGGCEVAALVGKAQAGEQALAVGTPLSAGMELQTGPDARLRLRCSDGSSLVMAANARLRLEVMDLQGGKRQELRWHLSLGLIGQKVSPGGRWSVRTPTAVTAVRGTAFTVEVGDDNKTAVLMQEGSLDVTPSPPSTRKGVGGLAAAMGISLPALVLANLQGTDCAEGACGAAATWKPERVQRTLDRLSGI